MPGNSIAAAVLGTSQQELLQNKRRNSAELWQHGWHEKSRVHGRLYLSGVQSRKVEQRGRPMAG
jgi:hypothetical protein